MIRNRHLKLFTNTMLHSTSRPCSAQQFFRLYFIAVLYWVKAIIRQPHHIVMYLQNTYFEKNGFQNFRELIDLVCLIEICFETNMFLQIWSIYKNSHLNSLYSWYFVFSIVKSKEFHARHYVKQNKNTVKQLRHFSPRYINGMQIRHYVKQTIVVNTLQYVTMWNSLMQ